MRGYEVNMGIPKPTEKGMFIRITQHEMCRESPISVTCKTVALDALNSAKVYITDPNHNSAECL